MASTSMVLRWHLPTLAVASRRRCVLGQQTIVAPLSSAPSVMCRYKAQPAVPDSPDGLLMFRVEQDVREFCAVHPELGKQCWSVHHWLVEKCKDSGSTGASSEYSLQRTLREIMSAGDMHQVYRSLSMLKSIEERHRTGQHHAAATPLPSSVIGEQERLLLTQLFHQMDTNGDGHLSWAEFTAALHDIDDDLEEDEQELVSTALGLHGTLSLEQFLAVVQQAEEMREQRDACCDASRLRHLMHKDRRPDGVDRFWGTL